MLEMGISVLDTNWNGESFELYFPDNFFPLYYGFLKCQGKFAVLHTAQEFFTLVNKIMKEKMQSLSNSLTENTVTMQNRKQFENEIFIDVKMTTSLGIRSIV